MIIQVLGDPVLKKLVPSMGTLKAAAARGIASLDGVYVVFAELSEGTDIVEVYQHEDDAFTRRRELFFSSIIKAPAGLARP